MSAGKRRASVQNASSKKAALAGNSQALAGLRSREPLKKSRKQQKLKRIR